MLAECLVKLLQNDSLDIKERAGDILGHAAPHLSEQLRNESILKEAIHLMHDEN
jgi:hypothetical protein